MKPLADLVIVVPFWGDNPAYRAWLDQCLAAIRTHAPDAKLLLASDEVLPADIDAEKLWVDTSGYASLVDPAWAYDRKGAIVCAVLTALPDRPLLVLDADAFLVADPRPLLREFAAEPLALPVDEGAFGARFAPPLHHCRKLCAGVAFFGARTANYREILTQAWAEQFVRLRELIAVGELAEERRLLEQHAWCAVAAALNAPILPRELNWPASLRAAGENPHAAIHHHIGRRKWTGLGTPPAGVLNDRQLHLMRREKGGRP